MNLAEKWLGWVWTGLFFGIIRWRNADPTRESSNDNGRTKIEGYKNMAMKLGNQKE